MVEYLGPPSTCARCCRRSGVSRLHRIGQVLPQIVYILFHDHTVQRYLEAKNIDKFLSQLASYLPRTVTDRARDAVIGRGCRLDVTRLSATLREPHTDVRCCRILLPGFPSPF
jgi:hypothetical protein